MSNSLQNKVVPVHVDMTDEATIRAAGVVNREVFAEVPPRVEYSLTKYGRTLKPVSDAMCKWGVSAFHLPPITANVASRGQLGNRPTRNV